MRKVWFIVMLALVLAMPATALAQGEVPGSAADYAYDGYVIENYDIDIVVNENNTYDISLNLKIDWIDPARGPVLSIPLEQRIAHEDPETGKLYYRNHDVEVSRVSVNSKFSTFKENGKMFIRVGDASTYVTGVHDYSIRFRFDWGDDNIDAFDDFYYNLLAPDWDAPVESFTFAVHMPKPFDSKVGFSLGDYSAVGYEKDRLTFAVDGTTITGHANGLILPSEGVTIRFALPEGYYVGARTLPSGFVVAMAVIIAITAVGLLLIFTAGRRDDIVTTVEFGPPEGMDSADVGYIIDGEVENRDVVSLLIYWADKGYLSIHELSDKNTEFRKIGDLPADADAYEHTVFDAMFPGKKDTTTLSSMQYRFADKVTKAKTQVSAKYTGNKERNIFTPQSARRGFWLKALCPLPLLVLMGFLYSHVWEFDFEILFYFVLVYIIGVSLASNYATAVYTRISEKRSKRVGKNILIAVLLVIYYAVYSALMSEELGGWGIVVSIPSLVMLLCAPFTRRRTEYGRQMVGRILGLKRFIQMVEKDKLEMLVHEDPQYFYHVLPYAYVLGVTDTWARKFEAITLEAPTWYYGRTRYDMFTAIYFTSMLNSTMNSANTAMTARASSGGGGGGSMGGGGFSGGGFSGGGGGFSGGKW